MEEGIVAIIRKYLIEHDAIHIGIFGSYARGEEGPDSDIDVLVEFGTAKSLFDIAEYELELGDLVGKKIDLVTKPGLSLYFRNEVLSQMRVIF